MAARHRRPQGATVHPAVCRRHLSLPGQLAAPAGGSDVRHERGVRGDGGRRAARAAVGAGLQVAVAYDTLEAELPTLAAGYAVALPVAAYLLFVWLLQVRVCPRDQGMVVVVAFPVAAVLVLATPFTPAPVHITALL